MRAVPTPWTLEQDEFIRTHPDYSDAELAAVVDHPKGSVKQRRHALLGWRGTPTMVKPTDEKRMQAWRDKGEA